MVLEHEYVMMVCWYRWDLLDELTVLLLIIFGFSTPVIGLRSLWLGWLPLWLDFGPCDWAFAPVIGLRSLWLDYGPCDWVFTPAYRFSGFDSWFVTMRLAWFGGWFWGFGGLELGFFLGWFVSPLCYSVVTLLLLLKFGWFSWMVIRLISRLLVRSCVMLSWLDIGFVWLSLGYWFVQLIVVEYRFWTVEQFVGVYILYGCVNLFTSLCIPISPCGCEWWLLSILLLMVEDV